MNMETSYLDSLNDKQREAATTVDGAVLILAGAGSGKTSTMTRRIVYLIKEKNISPRNIFAVTFTNKAAREMRERVESLLSTNTDMWLMTFHAACLRILRMEAESIGYTSTFTIYDPTDQKSVIKKILKEKDIDEKKFPVNMILGKISKLKENSIFPSQFEYMTENFIDETISSVYKSYYQTLKKNDAMDFDDLILNTVSLFEQNRDILEKYQDRFKYIMVDEYQDTNKLQYKFIRLLSQAHGNICVVGDDDQCIYQWRGADISNILNFEKDFPNAKIIKLEQNYRSTANILEAAHNVIQNNTQRKAKKLWTSDEAGEKIYYERFRNDRMEASFVAREVEKLASRMDYKDIAILYRTNAQSRTFEDALTNVGIPYRVVGGLRYYDRMEIKDMISYLRLVLNLKDDVAFERIINVPKRSIGASTLNKLKSFANYTEKSLFEILDDEDILSSFTPKVQGNLVEFKNMILKYNMEKENLSVSEIYDGILIDSGYIKELENNNNAESDARIENLLEFRSAIEELQRGEEKELELYEFLEKLALLSDIDNHDSNIDAVQLMTMHSAKGLEFPYVFLPGMEDGLFPSWRSKESEAQLQEERRLCYVGITRAKKKLYMTSAEERMLFGKMTNTAESCFLSEIDENLLDGKVYTGINSSLGFSRNIDGISNSVSPNPFRTTTRVIREVKNSKKFDTNFDLGDRVAHKKFGSGTVKEINDKVVQIEFDDFGVKKLALGIAPITKL